MDTARQLIDALDQSQPLRHVLGNKLTLPLLVLKRLRAGERVTDQTLDGAVRDLEGLLKIVNGSDNACPPTHSNC
jgi:hypothetical protein